MLKASEMLSKSQPGLQQQTGVSLCRDKEAKEETLRIEQEGRKSVGKELRDEEDQHV